MWVICELYDLWEVIIQQWESSTLNINWSDILASERDVNTRKGKKKFNKRKRTDRENVYHLDIITNVDLIENNVRKLDVTPSHSFI